MTTRIFPIIALLLLTIAAGGCNSSEPVGSSADSVIWPLAVGNRWIGRWSYYNPSGGIDSTRLDTLSITGTATLSDGAWYYTNPVFHVRNTSEGCWRRFDDYGPHLMLKYPGAVGDTFNRETYVETFETGQIGDTFYFQTTITSIDKRVSVPRGTFTCYEYTVDRVGTDPTNDSLILDVPTVMLYAPDVGRVKEIYYQLDIGKTTLSRTWELVDYTLR